MTGAEWHRARDVISAALARPPQDREDFLAEQYSDLATRDEVSAVLHSCESNSQALVDARPHTLSAQNWTTTERTGGPLSVGPYVFEQSLGRGGMGEVFLVAAMGPLTSGG